MGQEITVRITDIGDVVLFDLDRSLTGQDGSAYVGPPHLAETGPPAELARRLFTFDQSIESVFILSNAVSVKAPGWGQADIEGAAEIVRTLFIYHEQVSPAEYYERLREENYNATISHIRDHHGDLWIMRVTPDEPVETYDPGQYTTLGLGFWEPRADHVMEDFQEAPDRLEKMARRSYSVSSSIVDDQGELVKDDPNSIEFYIVQVRPEEEEIPALTPRIFLKKEGDRLFMSKKFTGRYVLGDLEGDENIVFLSTGTGEAPQNAMTAELLRRGHQGPILNVVCVRLRSDLAYTDQQSIVQAKFPNYRYEAITTREPENEGDKVYIQDLIVSGRLEEMLGASLDPGTSHVFLCGNPAMIGLPKWNDDDSMAFPDRTGVCELLSERGFTIDHRRTRGNVHYEEYWKQ
jgi:ferredoxin--NADP+ reductase